MDRRSIPDTPSLEGLEERWGRAWEVQGTHRFDHSRDRAEVFSIDTPPPTVSGSLHVGHVFSYTHTDAVARYQRMQGREVFYPMGWDDNGLPTERRVQNYYGVRCDPGLPYDAGFQPPAEPPAPPLAVSRRNFVELCERLTAEDEQAFEHLWRMLGLSVDWSLTYTTIGAAAQRAAQTAFLRNLARGEAYAIDAPVLWDIDFRTAVAQAELEDRERPGALHQIAFHGPHGDPIVIESTRPELIPACVALVVHPDDERFSGLVGAEVRTPLFDVAVPVMAHRLAAPDKGTGMAMVCTFGDLTDVTWWRELALPARPVLGPDGRLRREAPPVMTDAGRSAYEDLAGKTVFAARQRIVELLADSGDLVAGPAAITHPVKFYEKGERPLEIMTTRQWYIRNGGRDGNLREALLRRGEELQWFPQHMAVRYRHWVEGLLGDWLISRQRFFGVPIPIWYPLDDAGAPVYERALTPDESDLPVDPASDVPAGYDATDRGRPNGFVGDPDVMDTWATSSLTPQIATGWLDDPDRFERTFPMDLRPQAHEIIRTWLFSSVVRSHLENDSLPWATAAISGWVLDPDRKKMSKSKGNVVTPVDLIHQYGADAVRYWAARGRPGVDAAFEEGQMKIGRRLAIKILNAARFVLQLGDAEPAPEGPVTEPLDRSLLAALARLVDGTTAAFDGFDYARALEHTETFFWSFTDDYVELVKRRAYGDHGPEAAASARAALASALSTLLRLFAPFLPYVTEEVWSWWQGGSIHRAPWPDAAALRAGAGDGDPDVFGTAATVLGEIRKAKTAAGVSLRVPVDHVVVTAEADFLAALEKGRDDVADAGNVAAIDSTPANEVPPTITVKLAETD